MTLDDLERPKRTVIEKTFYGALEPMILVSRNKAYADIRGSSIGEWASNDKWVVGEDNL